MQPPELEPLLEPPETTLEPPEVEPPLDPAPELPAPPDEVEPPLLAVPLEEAADEDLSPPRALVFALLRLLPPPLEPLPLPAAGQPATTRRSHARREGRIMGG